MPRSFKQVDVFGAEPLSGNPVAVVLEAEGLAEEEMRRFASWTNLSETTFVLPASAPEADYRARIFTPVLELPFAGHPTLGTCHAWLESGGKPRNSTEIVQECDAGLIRVRREGDRLAFAAPPLVRAGPASEEEVARVAAALGVDRGEMLAVEWVDNGPGWIAALFESADRVLELRPGALDFDLGVVGFHPPGCSAAIEVRAFTPVNGISVEDPVTGSLHASVAQWLLGSGRLMSPYLATQGGAIGRAGRVHLTQEAHGDIWVGGRAETVLTGAVTG
jgi:PhzF family phenazine biosynthesis protein